MVSGFFGILIGHLNDRIGPRIIVGLTALFFSAGYILMSHTNSIWELYLFFGFIFGIGLSSVDVIALTTVARWFPARRGLMTGIVKVGTGAGQFVFPLLASLLIAGYGWRNSFVVLGVISLIILTIIAWLLKKEPEKISNTTHLSSTDSNEERAIIDFSFFMASKTSQLWILCLINLSIVSCLMSVLVHIVPHARDIGISVHKASGVLSTIGVVSMAGRFITGMVIDRIGSKRSMMIAILVLITSMLWLKTADQLWKLYLFAAIYGLAHGGFFTVISPIVAELFGTSSHGSLFGMVVFFGTAGGAIGPVITGYIFDMTGSYILPIWIALLVSLLGLSLLMVLTPVARHSIAKQP